MTLATRPPRAEPGVVALRGDEPVVGRPTDRAIHGIVVGCVACAPFWLALLILVLQY